MGNKNPGGAKAGFTKLLNSFMPPIDIIPERNPTKIGITKLITNVLSIFLFTLSPLNNTIKQKKYSHKLWIFYLIKLFSTLKSNI